MKYFAAFILMVVVTAIIIGITIMQWPKEKKLTLNDISKDSIEYKVRKDTVFLNFTFGMNEAQFRKRLKTLYKEKVIYINDENQYAIKLVFETSDYFNAEATFAPEFYKDSLYKFTVIAKPIDDLMSLELLQLKLLVNLSSKYGYKHIESDDPVYKKSKIYTYKDQNRVIELFIAISSVKIVYTDITIEKRLNKELDKKTEVEKDKTKRII